MSRVVARGSIRVDARRAVQKLREHLLVDLNLYLLELVRGAAAGGATQIDVRCDADSVILTFDGEPLDEARLTRLLDHVLDAAPGREPRRLRLLALGVNAALGLRPAHVDVLSTGAGRDGSRARPGEARCVRVRFTPAMLDAEPAPDNPARAGLTTPPCEEVPTPPGMPATGLRIEVRRRLGWSALRRALTGDLPPEVAHLAAATGDFAIPIALAGARLRDARRAAPDDVGAPLVRVPFQVRGTRRATLEVVAPALASAAPPGPGSAPPSGMPFIDYLEHGVRLLREAWSFAPRFPSTPYRDVELPVRIVVDADELPTNASRSALREDAAFLAPLREAAAAALHDAICALAAIACGVGEVPDGAQVLDADRGRLEDALAAIACVATGAARRGDPLTDEARAVRDLPLLRDGIGRPVSPASLDARGHATLYVWRGDAPLPESLAAWTRDVVWARSRLAELTLDGLELADAAVMIEQAKRGAERRRAFLAHAQGDPVVPPSPDHVFRAAFDVREGGCAGLRGEIAVVGEGGAASAAEARDAVDRRASRRASVRVFVEGRHLETVELDPDRVPLPVEIALAWEGHLRARFSYEGAVRDVSFRRAVAYALRVAIRAADAETRREGDVEAAARVAPPPDGPIDPGGGRRSERLDYLLRATVGTLVQGRLGGTPAPAEKPGEAAEAELLDDELGDLAPAALQGLYDARIWPTTEPGRVLSLRDLTELAARAGALCVAPTRTQGIAADGRPVIALPQRELDWIAAAIPGCELVPYAHAVFRAEALASREGARMRALASSLASVAAPHEAGAPVLEVRRPAFAAIATPSDAPIEAWHHALRHVVTRRGEPSLAPLAIALDDDAAMPDRRWSGLLSPRNADAVRAVELELCGALVAALEGDPAARARLGMASEEALPSTRVTAYLLGAARALASRRARAALGDGARDLAARVRMLPLIAALDAQGAPVPCSLDGLEDAHPLPRLIPALDGPPGFATLDWRPVVLRDARERDAFLRWADGRARMAADELPERRRRAIADRERRAFLAGSELDPRALGDLADAAPRSVFLPALSVTDGGDLDVAPPLALPGALGISAAAALPRAGAGVAHAWIDVLFCRRALCRRALPSLRIPIVARVDVSRPEHVEALRDLSLTGVEQVADRVHEAAVALALALIADARPGAVAGAPPADAPASPASAAAAFADARTLALVAGLLDPAARYVGGATPLQQERLAALAAQLAADDFLWPTAQGEQHPLSAIQRIGKARCASAQQFAPWPAAARRSQLDAPVLFVPAGPEGEQLRTILASLGVALRDVTAELATLRARRAEAASAEAPRLSGAPAHPLLRQSLATLGLSEAEGELEIVEGPASDVCFIGLDGAPVQVPAEIPIPLRILARLDSVAASKSATHALLTKLAKAAGRHLIAVAPHFDQMPPFARAHMRRAVCRTVGDGKKVAAKAASAPLFPTIDGRLCSLNDLRDDPSVEWACTHAPPPYPKRGYPRPVLCISETERLQLAAVTLIKNITPIVSRDRAGEERAAAPELATIALDEDTRAKCFEVIPFDEAPGDALGGAAAPRAHGEIGLLVPEHDDAARIAIHVGRRPLCATSAGEGWPLCAAINDDALTPNRYFDGLRSTAAGAEVRRRVRDAAARWLRSRVAPPEDALAVRWIDVSPAADRSLRVTGALWLPARWPSEPRVLVTTPTPLGHGSSGLGAAPIARALSIATGGARLRGLVPVEGALLVWPRDARWSSVAKIAMDAAASMVAELAAARPDDPSAAPYRWDLHLLGCLDAGDLRAATASGDLVTAAQVVAELDARGSLWITARRGSADGEFPDGTPSFVLLGGDGEDPAAAPLLRVLRHRAAPGVLRELGGLTAPPVSALDTADPLGPRAEPTAPATPGRSDAAVPTVQGPRAWMGELWHGVRTLLTLGRGAPPVPSGAQPESALVHALRDCLVALRLDGDPVRAVVESRSGRPVRYEPSRSRVVVNPHHESLAWLRSRGALDPASIALLAAAAVCEVNRSLKSVTDAEERRAIDHLLRSID